jgi:DNA-binding HxlR family transcriptional regulator
VTDDRDSSTAGPPTPDAQFMQLLAGKWVTASISAAARLGIAEALDSPRSSAELAARLNCHPRSLDRLLRMLASEGVLALKDDLYSLTELGTCLRKDQLGELADFVGVPFMWDPWTHLDQGVRDGSSAFSHATGSELFDYLRDNKSDAALYHRAVDAFTRREARALAQEFDFSASRNVVDLGGGLGTLIVELLSAWPNLRGTLFDRLHVIEQARDRLGGTQFAERVDLCAGDFTESVPEGRDTYVLKHVVHNWPDDVAVQVLRNCVDAMTPDGRVLVVEGILLPGVRKDATRLLDLEMMVLCGEGRERTKQEFRSLFRQAGLRLERTLPIAGTTRLLIGTRRKP